MSDLVRHSIMTLAAFIVFAGFAILCADAETMEAFLISKVVGGVFCVAGLTVIAHLDKREEN